MSLFVGNVSKKVGNQQIEDAFKFYGPCKIDLRKRYAFIQFESERCAQQAKQALQNVNFSGLRLNIQWSKNSGRFNQNRNLKPDNNRRKRSNSRDRTWRREDRYMRRSPSHQRRHAPNYDENKQQLAHFVPFCPRDQELYRRLKQKFSGEQGQMIQEKPLKELQAGQAA